MAFKQLFLKDTLNMILLKPYYSNVKIDFEITRRRIQFFRDLYSESALNKYLKSSQTNLKN